MNQHENNASDNNEFTATSPQQQQKQQHLYMPVNMNQIQYNNILNSSYSTPSEQQQQQQQRQQQQRQESNTSPLDSKYHWQNSSIVTSDMDMTPLHHLSSSQSLNTMYDQSIPPNYSSLQQSNSMINGQYGYHQHRGSLPIIQPDQYTTNIQPTITTAPYARRHTEGSISAATRYANQTRKQKTESQKHKKTNGADSSEEDKRKHFLERNRQAALKCRQRKKQWLADLQHRVEFLSTDNEQLQSQATMLREEVINLKTLLLAHRDCKVAQANGTTVSMIQNVSNTLTMPSANSNNDMMAYPNQQHEA
ncbi:hypothetical protein CU098_012156 [Rhizopus stolonifer]|uniref:BZIP domain-containing protein n=1 Tax=Rhizopus stolonifer TaxID=4846 RepID=A0A367KKD7_RHIST|nr:hypothetical protein CU098_012156 [Rhizopus stolonifer]